MEDRGITLSKNQLIMVALFIGIVLLGLGFFQAGYIKGYSYVKEYQENYIEKNCICTEPYNYINEIEKINLSIG